MTADTAQEAALNEGLAPLMGWVKRLADHVMQDRMGAANLEFAWLDPRPIDAAEQAKLIDTYVRSGIYTVNEARDMLGLAAIPGGDTPSVYTAAGPVPLAGPAAPNPPPQAGARLSYPPPQAGEGRVGVFAAAPPPAIARVSATPLAKDYDPDEPRVPAGDPDGGQWTSDGGGDANTGEGSGQTGDPSLAGKRVINGVASWYNLPGHRMANGKMFDPHAMNAAMLDVPLGTVVTVELENDASRSIEVTVTDRGPYAAGRVIDLTKTAFHTLVGDTGAGLARVRIKVPR